jgi:hypothetical protein
MSYLLPLQNGVRPGAICGEYFPSQWFLLSVAPVVVVPLSPVHFMTGIFF